MKLTAAVDRSDYRGLLPVSVLAAGTGIAIAYSPLISLVLFLSCVGAILLYRTWHRFVWFYVPLFFLGFPCYSWALGMVMGSAPPVAFLLVLLATHTLSYVARKEARPERVYWQPLALSITWISCMGVSLLWSPNTAYGGWKLGMFGVLSLVPFVIVITAKKLEGALRQFGSALMVIVIVLFCEMCFWGDTDLARAKLFGGNPIWLSRIAVLGLFSATLNLGSFRGPLGGCFRAATVAAAIWIIVETGSRGPVVALLVALGLGFSLSLVSMRKLTSTARYLIVLSIMVVALVSPLLLSPADDYRYLNILRDPSMYRYDPRVQGRLDRMERAWGEFAENPLFGLGLGGYASVGRDYPHNLLLEIASENGVFGVFLFGALVALAASKVRLEDYKTVGLLTLPLLFSFVSGDLATNNEWMIATAFVFRSTRLES